MRYFYAILPLLSVFGSFFFIVSGYLLFNLSKLLAFALLPLGSIIFDFLLYQFSRVVAIISISPLNWLESFVVIPHFPLSPIGLLIYAAVFFSLLVWLRASGYSPQLNKFITTLFESVLIAFETLYEKECTKVSLEGLKQLTPIQNTLLKSLFAIVVSSSIDLLVWFALTNIYCSVTILSFVIYLIIKELIKRFQGDQIFWTFDRLDEIVYFSRVFSFVGAIMVNDPAAVLFRFFTELGFIYSTSFLLKKEGCLLCEDFNNKYSELAKYPIFRVGQVEKTVIMSLLFWAYYANPISQAIHLALPISIGLLFVHGITTNFVLGAMPATFKVMLIVTGGVLAPLFDLSLMYAVTKFKQKAKLSRETGLEIFSKLFSSDAYRPLIGNAPAGEVFIQLTRTIFRGTPVVAAPVVTYVAANHISESRHQNNTNRINNQNLDRVEKTNPNMPVQEKIAILNAPMNPEPRRNKPFIGSPTFGFGKK